MTPDSYLRDLLRKYEVNSALAEEACNELLPILVTWSNGHLARVELSGSIAKETGVSLSNDADIFLSLSSTAPGTLEEMYSTLANAIEAAGFPSRRQDVSIGTRVKGLSIDVVPGRRTSQFGNEHSLYRNRTGSWTKTDVTAHIKHVINSRRHEEIRLLKLWRTRYGLRFPSFYLELVAIDTLRYSRHGDLAVNFISLLMQLQDRIERARYVDPANTNNVVSDDCTAGEKKLIAQQAKQTLGKSYWEEMVW